MKPGEVDAGDQRFAGLPPAMAAALHGIEQRHRIRRRWHLAAFLAGVVLGAIIGGLI
jgi:hypothetical protein